MRKKKIRKNIMLAQELDFQVKEAAGRYKTSQSAIVEKALTKFLTNEKEQKQLPKFFEFAGSCNCEHKNLSVKYKEVIKGKK